MCFLLLPEHGRLVVYDWLLLLALLQEEQEVPDIFTEDRLSNYRDSLRIF